MPRSPKVWFITGASRGFGLALARRVLETRDAVIAAMRDPSNGAYETIQQTYSPDKLLVVQLDVTKEDQVTQAFARAKDVFGQIDVVFNNAGYSIVGELESVPIHEARAVLETDFWGTIHVTRAALAFFRDVNQQQGGRIIQNSSMVARAASPLTAFYAASKAALEAATEALAQELNPAWNIKVTIVAPGAFRTDIMKEGLKIFDHPAYTDPNHPLTQAKAFLRNMNPEWMRGDPDKFASLLLKIADLDQPPLRVPAGKDAWDTIDNARKRDAEESEKQGTRAWSEDLEF